MLNLELLSDGLDEPWSELGSFINDDLPGNPKEDERISSYKKLATASSVAFVSSLASIHLVT
jgi:hypothetical protein